MIVTSQKLITCDPGGSITNDCAIAISDTGNILAVGTTETIMKKFSRHRIHRLRHAVLLPGFVNLHTHLELPSLLDMVSGKSFPDWILNLIRAKKDLGKQDYLRAAKINIKTLIRSGTTTVGEICTHGASSAILKQAGLRAVVFHEIISMNPDQSKLPLWPVSRPSSLMQSGLSPHSPYTVSESALHAIIRLVKKKDIRIAMHIAESKDETELLHGDNNGLERLYHLAGWDLSWAPRGHSSIEYLKRIGFLFPNLLAVHAVHVTKKDIELIKKSKVSVAHCPRSNKATGVGIMPLKQFIDAGINVGLGTDSLASSPSLNMWDEMRYAYQVHRKNGVSAEDIFKLATINGASALGLNKMIGTLEPGKRADIIAVPLPSKNTGDIYSDLLRETKSCIMTMVDGKILFQGSRKAT
jgi:cytosine/adenosine deaminase-related metal-dependent hydrolase